jgi:hypothetical protein
MAGLFVLLYLVVNKLRLNASCFFNIEPQSAGLRLIVFNGDTEWVCHKVKDKDIKNFLQAEVAHLFKGRLQLIKNQDNISVQVKG